MGQQSHGLPGRVLVFRNESWYCIACGGLLENTPGVSFRFIHCVNEKCKHYLWVLLRPDLSSCEVFGSEVSNEEKGARADAGPDTSGD